MAHTSKAKHALSDKVLGSVKFEFIDTDLYGLTIGHTYLGDRHINRESIRQNHD